MKHVIGKRNGKTIVSGGGSLEEQKNNLKHWEVLDSVGGPTNKPDFSIDKFIYVAPRDIYIKITADWISKNGKKFDFYPLGQTEQPQFDPKTGTPYTNSISLPLIKPPVENDKEIDSTCTIEMTLGIPDDTENALFIKEYRKKWYGDENSTEPVTQEEVYKKYGLDYSGYHGYENPMVINSINTRGTCTFYKSQYNSLDGTAFKINIPIDGNLGYSGLVLTSPFFNDREFAGNRTVYGITGLYYMPWDLRVIFPFVCIDALL